MTLRQPFDRLSQRRFLVGFVVGVVAAIILALLVEVFRNRSSLTAGDWMTFSGAVFGSAITVVGAVFVTRWQSVVSRRNNRALLRELLGEVIEYAGYVRSSLDHDGASASERGTYVGSLGYRISFVRSAREWIVPDNAAMIRAFGAIDALEVSYLAECVKADLSDEHAKWVAQQNAIAIQEIAKGALRELDN